MDDEGCLSLQDVLVPVERPVTVTLEGVGVRASPCSFELAAPPSRVVQHELDHLDGVLIIDRTSDEARREALATLRPQPVLGARGARESRSPPPRPSAPTCWSGSRRDTT